MKIALCYIAVSRGRLTEQYATRFARSYAQYPPGYPHETLVICNGGPLSAQQWEIFSGLRPAFFPRINDGGYDISGYIEVAKGFCRDYDAMLCLGESCYFHRQGWLHRLAEAWHTHGEGLYGPFATNVLRAHLMTTAFMCHPRMLKEYPKPVANKRDRYEFEHGAFSFWRRLAASHYPVKLVTWDGEWDPQEFRKPANIMWRGDQSNLLFFCNHSDQYRDADPQRKAKWARSADRPYK